MKKFFTLFAAAFASASMMFAQDVEWGPNQFENSDCEGEDFPFFYTKPNVDNPGGEITNAVATAGAGVDGSKGIVVVAASGATAAWDSQFWIQVPEEIANAALENAEQIRITFDCRADFTTIAGEEVDEVNIGTQGHSTPGNYLDNNGCGTVSFKKEWTKHEATLSPSQGVFSIAFNLCQDHFNDDVTFYFDNITIQNVKPNEEKIKYWAPLIQNGDFESASTDSYVVRIYQQGDSAPEIEEGIGVDESSAIKVVVPAKKENSWDSQFFIKMAEPLVEGQMLRVKMAIKASEDGASIESQCHTVPGNYIHYQCLGNVGFTSEWTQFEKTISVSSDMSTSEKQFQTIAFNLATADHEVTYYFDNIDVRVMKEGNAGDVPELIELRLAVENAENTYGSAESTPANSALRQAFMEAYDAAQEAVDNSDTENCEALKNALVNAKSKFDSSVKDYKNLEKFIAWVEGKMDMAEKMGDNYSDLKDDLDAISGDLHDKVNAEEWGKEEINAATNKSDIIAKIAKFVSETVEDGDDITILMENPSFAGTTEGWNRDGGSKFLDYGPSNRNTLDPNFDQNGGYLPTGMAEVWHGSFDAYQVMTNLPAGLYSITANACQRGDDGTEETAMMYAIVNGAETHKPVMSVYADPAPEMLFDSDAETKWPSIENPEGEGYIPNGKGSANYHLNAGYYLNTLNVLMNETGDIRFGIKDANTTNWVVMDNFKVIYHSLDNKLAMATALEGLIAQANEVKDGGLTQPADDALFNAITKAEDVVADIETVSKEDCSEAFDKLLAAIDDAKANVKAMAECETVYYEQFSSAFGEFAETAMPAVAARAAAADENFVTTETMTTEQLKAYTAELTYLCDALLVPAEAADATEANPVDLTDALLRVKGVDVDFEDYAEVGANANYPGWSGSGFGTGGGTAGPVGERWNQSNGFDTYVVLHGLPEGKYVLSCDGAYRTSIANDYNRLTDGSTTDNEAFLYATTSGETVQSALHNIATGALTEEQAIGFGIDPSANCSNVNGTVMGEDSVATTVKYYFPDQLYTADQWMQAGLYKDNKVTINVPADGTLRIGVKRKGAANDWCFVDNFQLIYLGVDETAVRDINVAGQASEGIYSISGVRLNKISRPGIYIVNGKKVLVK